MNEFTADELLGELQNSYRDVYEDASHAIDEGQSSEAHLAFLLYFARACTLSDLAWEYERAIALDPMRDRSLSRLIEVQRIRFSRRLFAYLMARPNGEEVQWLGRSRELESWQRISDVIRAEVSVRARSRRIWEGSIILAGPREPVVIRGRLKSPLTRPRYAVIRALHRAQGAGLSKDGLIRASGHGDAVNILKRLAAHDDDWASVISLAGVPGGGYRLES